mgnify:CR=1 FL=1
MNLKLKWNRPRRGGLLENTVMLYILQFSNMALGLLTQGYQMRVLGLDLKTADADACRIEHVISDENFERLKAAAKPES